MDEKISPSFGGLVFYLYFFVSEKFLPFEKTKKNAFSFGSLLTYS